MQQDKTHTNTSQNTGAQYKSTNQEYNIQIIQVDLPSAIVQPQSTHHKLHSANTESVNTDNSFQRPNRNGSENNELFIENKKLRAINKQLRRKLQAFQKRLDQSIKSKKQIQVKTKVGQEIVQSMQLKNAYKMCQIYKKQIAHLKRKEEFNKQGKLNQLANLVIQLQKQKQKLNAEIKDLKKINRQQEKGIKQMANPNFFKLVRENQQLKEQLKKVADLRNISQGNLHANLSKISLQKLKEKDKVQSHGSERLKTLGWEQEPGGNNLIQTLKNKVMKDSKKISLLMSQNSKLRQNLQQLRNQVIQKDKEFAQLRERFITVRKQTSFVKKRVQTESISVPKTNENTQKPKTSFQRSHHKKFKSQYQQTQRENSIKIKKNSRQKQVQKQKHVQRQKYVQKYPKLLQAGQRKQQSYKWNHHQFSSKIKEVQVYPHQLGHIKQINFRYEKGQPNKLSKNKYASFCCQQNTGQYIKIIRGGFKNGLLRYLVVESSSGRKSNFCQHQLEEQCQNFEFKCKQNEYIGAFFGENSIQGINRVGCLIQLTK